MQKAVDMWGASIKTTGGAIRPINATGMLLTSNGKTPSGNIKHLMTSQQPSPLKILMEFDTRYVNWNLMISTKIPKSYSRSNM